MSPISRRMSTRVGSVAIRSGSATDISVNAVLAKIRNRGLLYHQVSGESVKALDYDSADAV